MAQAYIDDSGDDKNFVLAGYVASKDAWENVSSEWKEELSRAPRLREFKMKRMVNQPDRCERFYRVIERHVSAGISVSVNKSKYKVALDGLTWPYAFENRKVLTSPYWWAFQAIIDAMARFQTELQITEPVDFVFDEQSEKRQLEGSWENYKSTAPAEMLRWMGQEPVWQWSLTTPGLQVADLRAWWVRKWLRDEVNGFQKREFAWPRSRDVPGFHLEMTQETLRDDFRRLKTKAWNCFAAKHLHVNRHCGGWWSTPGGVALHLPYLGGTPPPKS